MFRACPFCGQQPLPYDEELTSYVTCGCGCEGPGEGIEGWNKRGLFGAVPLALGDVLIDLETGTITIYIKFIDGYHHIREMAGHCLVIKCKSFSPETYRLELGSKVSELLAEAVS